MLARIRAWRRRTKVLVGVPAGLLLLVLGFIGVRGIQYAIAGAADPLALLPPGAHAVVRVRDLPAAWPKLRTSPLVRLLLGREPEGDVVHDLARTLAGEDPLPAALTEDRLLSLLVRDATAAVYDIDDPARDLVVVVELPFLYYAPMPFAGLLLGDQGSIAMSGQGRTVVIATRRERLEQLTGAGAITEVKAPGPGVAVSARFDLEAIPADSPFRLDLTALLESVPYREVLHAVNLKSIRSLAATVSTDGTTIGIDALGAMERKRLDRRLASLYAQPPLPAALLDGLPSRAAGLSAFRLDAEREWGWVRELAAADDRENRGEELGEAVKFAYANLRPLLDDFEQRGFARRLFPHVGDSAAVVIAPEKSEDILLGSAAAAVAVSLKDEKAAMAVIDEFTGADQLEETRKGIRFQKYGNHILRVIESRNRWKEGVSFAYGSAGKTLVAGTSLPLVRATIDRLDQQAGPASGTGTPLSGTRSMIDARRTVDGETLGQAFLWVDLVELSKSLTSSADKFAQQRADRLIDRKRLREEIEQRERPRFRPRVGARLREEFDEHVAQAFEQKVAEIKQGYVKEIKDAAAEIARYGVAALSIEGKADEVRLRGVLRLSPP